MKFPEVKRLAAPVLLDADEPNSTYEEQAPSPVTSCVSMRTDQSVSTQDAYSDSQFQQERAPSPDPSCVSMRTDQSVGTQDAHSDSQVQKERAPSPGPSCVSMKTEKSIEPPVKFKENSPSDPHRASLDEVACDLCMEKKQRAVKSCLTCLASYCETHIRQHYTVTALQKHKLVDAIGGLEERTTQLNVEDWVTKVPPPPGKVEICSLGPDFVSLSWDVPEGLAGQTQHFMVTWSDGRTQRSLKVKDTHKIKIENLSPGQKHAFNVATVGDNDSHSGYISVTVLTAVPEPDYLSVDDREAKSFTVSWRKPGELDSIPHRYLISSTCPEAELIYTTAQKMTFSHLEPGERYSVKVSAVLDNGEQSKPAVINVRTKRKRDWDDDDDYDYDYDDDYEDEDYENEEIDIEDEEYSDYDEEFK